MVAHQGDAEIYTIENETTSSTAYVLKDHLGSISCLTNETGALIEELSFDAWGRRRNPTNWEPLSQPGTYSTLRGYTGHEHIDIAALVNMNGRIYDPVVGRFLSPDPFMQAPDYTQGLNRYSYCLNNPLSLIDPSGYSWLSRNWKSLVATAVAITVTIATAGTGAALGQAILSGALGGFAGGVTGSLLNGGSIGNALVSGVIGGVIGGLAAGGANLIGNAAQGLGSFQKELARSLAHGTLGGLTSVAQGGKFKHGFYAGAFASMAGSGMQASKWGTFQTTSGQLVTAAVVGGTASELGGGKFANGAVTGAYSMLFNHMAHRQEDDPHKQITDKVNQAAKESHDFYASGGFYEGGKAITVDFTLNGWEKNPTTRWLDNKFENVQIMLGDKTNLVVADVYMNTAGNPTNSSHNIGVEFIAERYSPTSTFYLPKGHNFSIYNGVATRYQSGSPIVIINFQNQTDMLRFKSYVTW